jgi:serine/threonine protein kinase
MLTGRRPFEAKTISLTLQQIIRIEAKPPRQIKDTIPKELERICLKALSKNLNNRYLTGLDFSEDLQNYLKQNEVVPSMKNAAESNAANLSWVSSFHASLSGSVSSWAKISKTPGMDSVNKILESGASILQSALESSDKDFSVTRPLLEQHLSDIKDDTNAKTRVLLALLPADPSYAKALIEPLLVAKPQDYIVMRQRLAPYAEIVIPLLEQKFAQLPDSWVKSIPGQVMRSDPFWRH